MFSFFPKDCQIPKKELDELRADLLRPFFAEKQELLSLNLLPPLFHYTTCAGFQGIVTSGVVRATHIAFMNDSSEYIHAVNIMGNAVEHRLNSEHDDDAKRLLEYLLPRLDANRMFLSDFPPLFVACFSAVKDDLSQWRAYGRGEDCWSLEFDTRELLSKTMLLRVIYEKDAQRESAEFLLDYTLSLYKRHAKDHRREQAEHLENWYQMWRVIASYHGPRFKNESFASEHEWRMVYQPQFFSEITFTARPQMMCPIVDIGIGQGRHHPEWWADDRKNNESMPDKLPLRSVMKGPGNSKPLLDLSSFAATCFLRQYDYYLDVESSKVPYRTS